MEDLREDVLALFLLLSGTLLALGMGNFICRVSSGKDLLSLLFLVLTTAATTTSFAAAAASSLGFELLEASCSDLFFKCQLKLSINPRAPETYLFEL